MKTWPAFAALLVLVVVPARAEDDDKVAALRGDIELLELGRDVDKALLREAMMMAGRSTLGQAASRPDSEGARKRSQAESDALNEFMKAKEDALLRRWAELGKTSSELTAAMQKASRPKQPVKPNEDKDRPELIEKMEEAQVGLQLLQLQSQMYQQKLNEALNNLARAEFAASNDGAQRSNADTARKEFTDVRKKYVEFSKNLRLQQEKVAELQNRLGLGGMGGMGRGFQ